MPKVSVIIPTYNREDYVVKTLDSVLCQNFKDYEIIVVDDGSTDNTGEKLKKYKDKIKYIYQKNSGVSAARNKGISQAKGEWLAFLDSDDEWDSDYLYEQMEHVGKYPELCMQTADSILYERPGEGESYYKKFGTLPKFKNKEYLFIDKPFSFTLQFGPWLTSATIFRYQAVMKAGIFDTSMNFKEDYDLMVRVALQGPLGLIRKKLVNYYRREETTECLTNEWILNPIGSRETHENILKKLMKYNGLGRKEVRIIKNLLSANRRAIGNLYLRNGEIKEARISYKQALFIDPSIASLSKYILSFLPVKANLWLIDH
jgi:glycosyltransferase involved in cell wall biosynthesis